MSLNLKCPHKSDVSRLINELLTSEDNKNFTLAEDKKAPEPLSISSEICKKICKLTHEIRVVAERLDGEQPVEEQEKILYSLASKTALLDMTIRSNMVEKHSVESPKRQEKGLVKGSYIHIYTPEKTLIRVVIPPLIGRQFKGSYNIYWKLKVAFAQYEETRSLPRPDGEKLVLIYKRYSKNLSVVHSCDNDNWEMKRVTNAISEALNYSDNTEHFSMLYTTVKSDTDCVEATVVKQKDLHLFLDYMVSEKPEIDIYKDVK